MIFEERQIEKNNFSSRAILLFGLIIFMLLVVLIKVFSLQVSGYTDYQLAALKNKNYAVPVQALRGEIYDRNGRVLVKNEPTFDLITRPNLISNIDSFLEAIEPVIFLSQIEKDKYKKLQKDKAFVNKELVDSNGSARNIIRTIEANIQDEDRFVSPTLSIVRLLLDSKDSTSSPMGWTNSNVTAMLIPSAGSTIPKS